MIGYVYHKTTHRGYNDLTLSAHFCYRKTGYVCVWNKNAVGIRLMQLSMIYSAKQIEEEVARLASEINENYKGEPLHIIVVMNGSFIFAADLLRKLRLSVTIDSIRVASYTGAHSNGMISLVKDLEIPIEGKNVLILEDIIDSGRTVRYLLPLFRGRSPKSLEICVLLHRLGQCRKEITMKFVGFECQGGFLVGYGLDIDGKCRELPDIYEIITPVCGGLDGNTM
jgi:hypoxanthine phosphoribosyltransferase